MIDPNSSQVIWRSIQENDKVVKGTKKNLIEGTSLLRATQHIDINFVTKKKIGQKNIFLSFVSIPSPILLTKGDEKETR